MSGETGSHLKQGKTEMCAQAWVGGSKRLSRLLRPVTTEHGLSLRGVKDADRTALENPAPSQLIFLSALGLPGPSSGQGQSLGKTGPEPGLGARVGIVTDSDEP